MRRILLSGGLLIAAAAFIVIAGGASNGSGQGTYKIVFDNAFGLVNGAAFKVAGVPAGTIENITLEPGCIKGNPNDCRAVVTVDVTQSGLGGFRSDAFCQSRPQSLIGEYFVDCQPGTKGTILKPGSTIPVTRTQSTIPADLLLDVLRAPYRQRLSLIIGELGAAVAGRSGDLKAALRRAVPAIDQTDNLLTVLANDSRTLQELTANSDAVVTALANNSAQVQRFIDMANRTATDTATQDANLAGTFRQLPGFLEQLRPTMQKLGTTVTTNEPVLANLQTAAGQLHRLLTDLPGFSTSAIPAIKTLGSASVTGTQAVQAAGPAVANLNRFAQPTPELAQNLAIVLHDLDDRSRAVEADTRSPGGKGFTGLEALLQYVFNQPLAINAYGTFSHMLAVDAFLSPICSPYATPQSIAQGLKTYGSSYRSCYSWLGPNQPGVNEPDPTNPGACVPDPGGAPPGEKGPAATACRLGAAADTTSARRARSAAGTGRRAGARRAGARRAGARRAGARRAGARRAGARGTGVGGAASAGAASTGAGAAGAGSASSPANASGTQTNPTQSLLNYLLAP